jgi:LPS-assembly protein
MSGAKLLRAAVTLAGRALWLAGVTAVAVASPAWMAAWAADVGAAMYQSQASNIPIAGLPHAGDQMLLESDQLVYDYDNDTVSAVGNVHIYYGGYTLQAEKVTYKKRSGRLIAEGGVTLTDPTGATITSDFVDVTDDFRDGFVRSLRVDTPQRVHFTADSAERQGGETTTFVNGAYTACEPCKDNPEKPPLWNVKAAKIVVNQKEHMVYFTDARIEFFGLPVAWLPYFAMADPAVQRKTGFLAPTSGYSAKLGAYASLPYFWALAPNYDLTITPTVFSRQGFLGQVEWRHRLEHGQYTITMAGIKQTHKDAFDPASASYRDWRGGIRTTGEFYINKDWTLGWDGTLTSDRTFTRDYSVLNDDKSETISTIHVTGLNDRNFAEARASYFRVLTDRTGNPADPFDPDNAFNQGRQAVVVPVVDYNRIADDPVFGGEVSFTSNLTSLTRAEDDPFMYMATPYYHGTAGTTVRTTKQVSWQRQFIGPLGQVITPYVSLRGDAFFLNGQTAMATSDGLTTASTAFRFMPTAAVEWSLPLLVTSGATTQTITPVAQLIVRPNEMGIGTLPNNDAQSLVFDTSNLFEIDKFSGNDRVEGGTVANIGVKYTADLAGGASIDGAVGQSIHLAGANSYATADLANVGPDSGLEHKLSDYVAGVSVDTGLGPRFSARTRLDQSTLMLNRLELEATTALGPVTASTAYLYLRSDPNSGILTPASVVRSAASVNLASNWRAFGSFTYDIANSAVASDSFGIAFDNDCLTFSLAYSATRESYTDIAPDRWLNFRLQLRTLGESSVNTNLSKLTN